MAGKSPRILTCLFLCIVCLLANVRKSAAQNITGTILGTVRDPQGAVVPNASVSAKNVGTGAERTVLTDASGGFSIASVPAGSYDVTVLASGFRTEVRSGITMTVGAAVRVDFALNVGTVAEIVEVTSEAPQVETTNSTMSGLVAENIIRELPLNGRDWLQLAVLQPGVNPVLGSVPTGPATKGLGAKISISGGRTNQNVYRVDGLVVNDQTNNSPGSALGVNMGVDAIREFSVLTNTYSAEYGRSSGGVINAITKSGTNTLHGTAFYFHRNSALDARNFFDISKPPFRRHQFGGSAGGEIKKDKLFFFSGYEGLRQFLSLSQSANTLSPNARDGILCANSACTSTTKINIDPRVQAYLPLFPLPNGRINGDTGQFINAAGQIGTQNYVTGKLDYLLDANTTLTGSYTFDSANVPTPDVFNEKLKALQTRNQRVILSMQHVFSSAVLNTIRTGFNRLATQGGANYNPSTPLLTDTSLGFVPGRTAGQISVPGLDTFGGIGCCLADTYWYTTPQFSDDLSWVKGRNNIHTGFSVEALRDNEYSPSSPNGVWTFTSILNFLTVVPQQFTSDFPGTDLYRGMRMKIFGAYFQDDLRLRPNLKLNLGLRYEPATVLTEINGKAAVLVNITDAKPTIGNPIYKNPTLRNFAPRVGFAWDPSGDGKTAIRSGFGIFDISPLPNLFNSRLTRSSPFFKQGTLASPPASSFPNGALNLLGPNSLQNFLLERSPHPAYKIQWNVNIQRQIIAGLTVTAGYVGARGIHLPLTGDDIDLVPPSLVTTTPFGQLVLPAARPIQRINSNFGRIQWLQWKGYSNYHGLQLNATERMRGLTLQGAYSWSKSIDIGSTEGLGSELVNATENPYGFFPNLNRAVSDFDLPQRFSLNTVWDVPSLHSGMAVTRFLLSGWEMSGIFTVQNGTPFSVRLQADNAGTGTSTTTQQRPDFKPGPDCPSPNAVNPGHPESYIKLQCFSYPAPGTIGNLGRNTLRGPMVENFDFSLFKNHDMLSEKLRMQFRAEFFNLLNRPNFGFPVVNLFNGQGQAVSANAGVKPPTVTTSRQIQFGMKLIW
jgi:Carboxypeptidase regulatory-like domain/TonB dependent receptor-like, beta-barrel